jgi:hypothetical protein
VPRGSPCFHAVRLRALREALELEGVLASYAGYERSEAALSLGVGRALPLLGLLANRDRDGVAADPRAKLAPLAAVGPRDKGPRRAPRAEPDAKRAGLLFELVEPHGRERTWVARRLLLEGT